MLVAATRVNPIDYKRRAGLTKDWYAIEYPELIGVDIEGTVVKLEPGVENFSTGEQVFVVADDTYEGVCAVKTAILAKFRRGSI